MRKVLPLLADIGHGIIVTLLAGLFFEVNLSWHFIVGVSFALLPDIDAVPRLIKYGSVMPTIENPTDHRDYLHFPILFLVLGLVLLFFHQFFGSVFLGATMLHLLNDTWGTGDGVKWLWPLVDRKYKFHKLSDWKWDGYTKEKISENDAWIDTSYLQVTSISLIEYATFLTAIIALVLYFLL